MGIPDRAPLAMLAAKGIKQAALVKRSTADAGSPIPTVWRARPALCMVRPSRGSRRDADAGQSNQGDITKMYDENDYVGRKGAIGSFFARVFMEGWITMLISKVRGR
jgi:hypothetical protein